MPSQGLLRRSLNVVRLTARSYRHLVFKLVTAVENNVPLSQEFAQEVIAGYKHCLKLPPGTYNAFINHCSSHKLYLVVKAVGIESYDAPRTQAQCPMELSWSTQWNCVLK